MNETASKDPLHGITLEAMLTYLVETIGWEQMAWRINIRCFTLDPSIKSSLVFLRRTEWARKKVERLYLNTITRLNRKKKPPEPVEGSEGIV